MSDRDWIAHEFARGIAAEQELASEARARADSPPESGMAVLYSQIAADDERHRESVEAIAVRYGHTPSRGSATGGIGETFSRLKDKVTEIGSKPHHLVADDLAAKANAIHWMTSWVHAFEAIGDAASARELAAILAEEESHRDALQEALNRLVAAGAAAGAVRSAT